nr:FtsW/RodA/SpoVE family cell cycle protein [uncultured Butyricicoccus sp.]
MRPLRSAAHYLKNTDLYLLILALCCSAYSLVLINSATASSTAHDRFMLVQGVATVIGVGAFVVMSLIDLEDIKRYWRVLLIFNLCMQISMFIVGQAVGGNRSWIAVGPITIQPGEIGKVLFIISFAAHLMQVYEEINRWQTLIQLGIHALLPFGAILFAQHDAGVAMGYILIAITMIFAAGISYKWVFGGMVLGLASVPIVFQFLSGYRLARILVLLDPSIDNLYGNEDYYYQTAQSKIAIGAGQISGSGYMQGLQTQYGKVPVNESDFIYTVAGEEFGLIGALLVIILLALLVLRLLYVSYRAGSTFSALLTVGIVGMFMFQSFQNILMCLGMFPVVGVTLPLFSYGGTSVVTMYAALGVAAGVRMRVKPSWLQK